LSELDTQCPLGLQIIQSLLTEAVRLGGTYGCRGLSVENWKSLSSLDALLEDISLHRLLELPVNLVHEGWLAPAGACPLHKVQSVAHHLKHCQAGTGKAALLAKIGRFLTMDEACLGATLPAFCCLRASTVAAMQLADPLA
jgi:hypothetical protein